MIHEVLDKISAEYAVAATEPFAKHPIAEFIRGKAAQAILDAAGRDYADLIPKGGAGSGQWPAVPWLALFDPTITAIAGSGFYVVYLFDIPTNTVHLSLNQGTREVSEEFGVADALSVLRERATLARNRLSDVSEDFDFGPIHFSNKSQLPRAYEAGHILGFSYQFTESVSEEELSFDLRRILQAYKILIFRGCLEFGDTENEDTDDQIRPLIERRKLKLHKVTERSAVISRAVKKQLGYVCQACGLDLEDRYGKLGRGYIEAHHMQPLSALAEGASVMRDPGKDFAVLCPNCHRMIHRLEDPSDIETLRKKIRT